MNHETQIVRLIDGQGFILPAVPDAWDWDQPIGLSCEHVYVLAHVRGGQRRHHTIARVRIDSLGEGSPPD